MASNKQSEAYYIYLIGKTMKTRKAKKVFIFTIKLMEKVKRNYYDKMLLNPVGCCTHFHYYILIAFLHHTFLYLLFSNLNIFRCTMAEIVVKPQRNKSCILLHKCLVITRRRRFCFYLWCFIISFLTPYRWMGTNRFNMPFLHTSERKTVHGDRNLSKS